MTKGRLGAVLVTKDSALVGIITDGDLRRMLANHSNIGSFVARDIMTPDPTTIQSDTLAIDGVDYIRERKINHLIVLNEDNDFGLVHIQDLIKEGLI